MFNTKGTIHIMFTRKEKKECETKIKNKSNKIKALCNTSDEDIDFSDIPELDFNKLGKPIIGKFYRPLNR